jgi:hypothetical protein
VEGELELENTTEPVSEGIADTEMVYSKESVADTDTLDDCEKKLAVID